jgi:hypothetical protein
VIRHLLIVATGFRFAGMLLGLASMAALVDVADTWLVMRKTPGPDTGPALDITTYGLVGLLHNAARAVGYGLHALGDLLTVLLAIVAAAAVLGVFMALLLYLTGSGIGRHATWARVVAILIASSLALASCAVMLVMRRDHAVFAALPIGLSGYALWVLIWRFT